MATLTTGKDIVLVAMSGASYSFKAHKPRTVSDVVAADLKSRYESLFYYKPEEIKAAVEEEVPEVSLDYALTLIIDRGNPDDFRTDGLPKATVVSSIMGKKVSASVINKRFAELVSSVHE